MWKTGILWDDEVDEGTKREFSELYYDLHLLKIPRLFRVSSDEKQFHAFCDTSQNAEVVLVFIRVETEERVDVHLLCAKSGVAPPKYITIPRLELLAALIGARLCATVLDGLFYSGRNDLHLHYWTDSKTVFAWIQNDKA
ncbi:hypothetical protein AVEN_249547-1 [Araneus ventricosus]|uniref:Reverse transcriptase RNase H-like domain-containing protein n=1 Tax=Araneus ventricosus TaxID=182803 RepID=A0A4Y2KLG7_ARAVE|nr:hypothetical protein AVEN_249547-1 [Araneus ventricosus]